MSTNGFAPTRRRGLGTLLKGPAEETVDTINSAQVGSPDLRDSSVGAEPLAGQECWSVADLRQELRRFARELVAANLAESSVHTYIDRSERFVRWLAGEYRPGER